MKSRKLLQLLILLLGFGVLFSLVSSETPFLDRQKTLLPISVLLREADSSTLAATRQGMEQAAIDFGAELRIVPLGVSNQAEEQRILLLHELEGGAAGIILVPADPVGLAPDVAKAAEQTVVVTLESDMSESGASACIAVDDTALGESLARAALNGLPAGGRVLLVNNTPRSTALSARVNAAAQVLRQAGQQVYFCLPQPEQSLADALRQSLLRHSFGAIIAFEATATEQAVRSTQILPRPPLIYGTGSTGSIVSYLEQSRITSIAAQNEFAAGYLAVQSTVEAIHKQPVQAVEQLDFTLIRLENMYDLSNQKLLFPVAR